MLRGEGGGGEGGGGTGQGPWEGEAREGEQITTRSKGTGLLLAETVTRVAVRAEGLVIRERQEK